jgi:hypothetical protein
MAQENSQLAFAAILLYSAPSNSFGRGLNGGFLLWQRQDFLIRPPVFPLFARLL